MSLLTKNTTPAERRRGCTFSETFETEALVNKNGGTKAGTPAISFGADFNGTTDAVSYVIAGSEFGNTISIVLEFTPDFDWDENASIVPLSTTVAGTNWFFIEKRNNFNGNVLRIYMGGTSVADIAPAAYSDYWFANQRNVLVISGTSGNTSAWLNGTQILTADATAWTTTGPTELYLGAMELGGLTNWFDGTIHKFSVFDSLLTAQEAADIYNETTYSYMDNVTGLWQMRMEDHDPVNSRTLDSSGNGHHMTFVSTPAKLSDRRGYRLDGTTDGFTLAHTTDFNPDGDFTVFALSALDDPNDVTSNWEALIGKAAAGGDNRGWWFMHDASVPGGKIAISADGTWGGTVIPNAKVGPKGDIMAIVATYDDSENLISVYDRSASASTGSVANTHASTAPITIGYTDAAYFFDGEIYEVGFIDGIALTATQVYDLMHTLQKRRNRV